MNNSIIWGFIVGGLALFLFGINLMGDGLTNFAGAKIRDYINKYTSNLFMAIIVGIILTGVIQSSSATTVIVISLVRSGLMRLDQAIGVTMGSNIGTTVTAVLVGFNVEKLSYFILFFGVVLTIIAKNKKQIHLAHILIGFSLVFMGLSMMGSELRKLQYLPEFEQFMTSIADHPVLGVIGGSIVTALIQSSSAVIGIVQKLYDTNNISLIATISIIFGANIGTCITAILTSIGGSVAAKRASSFHLFFNVIGALIFIILLIPYTHLIMTIGNMLQLNKMMTAASAHFIFNVATTLLFFPFTKFYCRLLEKIIPDKKGSITDIELVELDENMIDHFPAGALELSKNTIVKMGHLVISSIIASKEYLINKESSKRNEVNQIEEMINNLDTKVTAYLLKIAHSNLSDDLETEYATNLQVVKNIERISDLSQNLVEYYDFVFENKETMTSFQIEDLNKMYKLLIENTQLSLTVFENYEVSKMEEVEKAEDEMDKLEANCRNQHFKRLVKMPSTANVASSMYIDILSTMERMADHSYNVANITVNPVKIHQHK